MWPLSTPRYAALVDDGAAPAYHHGNLRAALVETGLSIARESGPEGIALREVARRVGVSHNAAYRHFGDREELLGEISHRAMARLTAAMRARIAALPASDDASAGARARLDQIGRAYVEFALAEPGLFRVAFAGKADRDSPAVGPPPGDGPYGLLNAALDDLVDIGYLDPRRRPGSEVACWAAVHGFAELCLDGPLRLLPSDLREAALSRLLDTIDRGLGGAA